MSYVYDIELPSDFPTTLPEADTLSSDAQAFGKHATTIKSTYDDTVANWNPLSGHMSFPNSEVVFGGLEKNVAPYADYLQSGITDMSAALTTFASDVKGFKSTWTTLKAEVVAFNNLPQEPVDSKEVNESITYRSTAARTALAIRLGNAASDYRGYVKTCVSSINDADSSLNPSWKGSTPQAFLAMAKKTWTNGKSYLDKAGRVNKRAGRWTFKFEAGGSTAGTPAGFLRGKLPGWLGDKVLGDAPKGPLTSMGGLFKDGPLAKYFNNMDPKKFSFTGGVDVRGGRALMLLGLPKASLPAWATTGKTGAVTGAFAKAGNKGLDGLKKADDLVKKLEGSKVMKYGGPALGILGAGLTYKDEFSKGYNESLRDHPEWTPEQHAKEAVTDAAIVGTAENAGKIAGSIAGRAGGAALGQVLIPIPGVGAAIGGFLGGIAGEWVGGKIGGAVGGFINDWREDGFGGALDHATEGVRDAANSVKDGAKKVFDKLTPW